MTGLWLKNQIFGLVSSVPRPQMSCNMQNSDFLPPLSFQTVFIRVLLCHWWFLSHIFQSPTQQWVVRVYACRRRVITARKDVKLCNTRRSGTLLWCFFFLYIFVLKTHRQVYSFCFVLCKIIWFLEVYLCLMHIVFCLIWI